MGDDGRLYVRPEMPAAFRDLLVPLASVLTPNQFEAEQLTGCAIGSEDDALAACGTLHARGPHTVVSPQGACGGSGPRLSRHCFRARARRTWLLPPLSNVV